MTEKELPLFETLSDEKKVLAILAVVYQPIPRELTLHFAGINYDTLAQDEKELVDGVFESPDKHGIEVSTDKEGQIYCMAKAVIDVFSTQVDLQSALKKKAAVMMNDLREAGFFSDKPEEENPY